MPTALTPRQEECLRLTRLLTDREIAAQLGVSEPTVKKHVLEACQRLGVNRRKAALAILEDLDAETLVERPGLVGLEAVGSSGDSLAMETAGRLGYRPPPRDPFLRALMIAVATVVCAVLVTTLTNMVASQQRQVRTIEAALGTLPDPPSPSVAAAR
jgi:DNA-binding CsgD family transcriptional regulator